jgi:hypothetical protein
MNAIVRLFDPSHLLATLSLICILGAGSGALLVLWFTVPGLAFGAVASAFLVALVWFGSVWFGHSAQG